MSDVSELMVTVEGSTIRAVGEIDYTSSYRLNEAVDDVLRSPGGRIEFDLRGVSFMDSSGIAVLLEAENRGARVRVSDASSAVELVIRATGLEHYLEDGE